MPDALRTAIPPEVQAVETGGTVGGRDAQTELPAERARALYRCLADRRGDVGAVDVGAGHRLVLVGHERRHAFPEAVSVRVAAGNAEHEAVEVVSARSRDASAEALIGTSVKAGESVRAIRSDLARNAAVDAIVVLASKAGNTVVGVVATGIESQTAPNTLVARVGRIPAIVVV